MHSSERTIPVVLSFSASHSSGGAGIQADIETLSSIGCHCTPIITTVIAEDTSEVHQFYPCPSLLVADQARAVLEDMPVASFKIGLLGSIENIHAVHQILKDYPHIPVVLDPNLYLGSKTKAFDISLMEALVALILPLVTLCTPNAREARLMAPASDTQDAWAHEIMANGVDYVLLTGNNLIANKITNILYGNQRRLEIFHWNRLDNQYQGAGSTLSASIAGFLAHQLPPSSAVSSAQEYTFECLKQGYRIGMGQYLPNRFYWAKEILFEYNTNHTISKNRSL